MLTQNLNKINSVLETFISITDEDLEAVRTANHKVLFDRNSQKEQLYQMFVRLKSSIDKELLKRSQSGLEISELFSSEEKVLFEAFKEKLVIFAKAHKKLSKRVYTVSHFYSNLMQKVTGATTQIGYETKSQNSGVLQLRG